MNNGTYFIVRRLLLVSPARKYSVNFKDGVNIIAGPFMTGKSATIRLIDYACGAKSPPQIPELSHCSDVLLELEISSEVLTIQRSLINKTASARFFPLSIDEVLAKNPQGEEIAVRHSSERKSISSQILERLGLSGLEIKLAPTQEASGTNAFSFRDLSDLMFVDQARIGSSDAFFEGNFVKHIKLKAAVEIVWNIHNNRRTAIAKQIEATKSEIERVERDLEATRRFLNDFKVPHLDEITEAEMKVRKEKESLEERARELQSVTRTSLGANNALVEESQRLRSEIISTKAKLSEFTRTIANLSRLQVQYNRELQQLDFFDEAQRVFGGVMVVKCPGCLRPLDPAPSGDNCFVCGHSLPLANDEVPVEQRIRALKRRKRDLEKYIHELEANNDKLQDTLEHLERDLVRVNGELAQVARTVVLPETEAIVALNNRMSANQNRLSQLEEWRQYRSRAEGEGSQLPQLRDRISKLSEQLKELPDDSVSKEALVEDLSERYREILRTLGLESAESGEIRQDYLPYLRGHTYAELSSAGAIALAISSYFFAFLERSLEVDSNFPRFIVLDSPLNPLGRDEADHAFRDQATVDRFYSYLRSFEKRSDVKFQVIVVDNRPPAAFREMANIMFTGDSTAGRYGLIDDMLPTAGEAH